MTSPEDLVYAALAAHSGVTALVGDRISPMKSLDAGDLPCITYAIVGCRPEQTHTGQVNMQDPLVQIDCWAGINDYDVLRSMRREVLDCLTSSDSPTSGTFFFVERDGMDYNEPDARMSRKMIEVTVWFDESR